MDTDVKDCLSCPILKQFDKLYELFRLSLLALIIISLGDKLVGFISTFIK